MTTHTKSISKQSPILDRPLTLTLGWSYSYNQRTRTLCPTAVYSYTVQDG
jgi:hypothetical protein